MKVSIVMLSYNHEKYLKKAIESVLNQKTNFKYELIIGDDCSKDNSQKIINEYAKRNPEIINAICRKKNVGAISNLKDILSKSKGEYIAILDGDDYWTDQNKLQLSIDFLDNNKDYIATFHNIDVVNDDNELIKETPYYNYRGDYNNVNDLFKYNSISTSSMAYRNIISKNTYNELFSNINIVADYPLKLYLLTLGKIKYINKKMGGYRYNIKSGSSYSAMGINGIILGAKDTLNGYYNLAKLCPDYKQFKEKQIEQNYLIFLAYLKYRQVSNGFKYYKTISNKIKGLKYILILPIKSIYKGIFWK